ncbi:FxSxx-COOH system tetratricopeptide repeat protein [Streptomyces sp. NPDC058290]|uniref:FxSxx-COOH system tetratricopeptide repeat protein n=1 Tax=Streptomyces sp. NPDC058290 TaxID=3346426 RepID=UPI0036EDD677
MDTRRVTEVWDPVGKVAGTGYLITDRLVLTAHHNIQKAAGSASERAVEVRRLALHGEQPSAWMAAEVLWPEQPPDIEQDPHTDAALLLITDAAWQPPTSAAPVRWGRLPLPGPVDSRVACLAVGFPEAEQRDGKRDTKQISGHIESLSGLKSGLVTAYIDDVATPRTHGAASSWSGASGAALFCGNLLIGVVITDRARNYPGNQLIAVPLATLAARPGFTSTIKVAGNSVSLEDVTTSVSGDSRPAGPYDVDAPSGLHNLPDLPPRAFVGRSETLSALAAAMEQDSKAITQTIQGLGGVGKTTLALHYAHAHRHSYQLVWWIRADTPEQIATDLAGLTARIHGGATGRTTAEDAEWAIGWLQTHPGWLLVLDNAEHPATTRRLTGQLHHAGRHLITSRFAHGWPTTPLALPLLTSAASLDLLTRLTGLTDPEDQHHARLLAEELGHLPLALEQAGTFIAQSHIPVSAYRDLLRQYPAQATDAAPAGSDPQRTMARIWRISLHALHRTTPVAVNILRTAAWYAPNAIPRTLLAPLADNPVSYTQALSQLAAYNMITLTAGTLSIHRLVQTVARTPDPDDPTRIPQAVDQARDLAAALLYAALPPDPETPETWPAWRALLPHIEAFADHAAPDTDTEVTADLLNEAVIFRHSQGQSALAVQHAMRAVADRERLLGGDHPETLTSRNNLAGAYQDLGEFEQAISLFRQNAADSERVLGPDDPGTLTCRNNLAGGLEAIGDLEPAITLYEQNLADRERLLGADHPDTLASRNNLGHAYASAGRMAPAVALFERTLADRQRLLGEEHPDTVVSRTNLAYGSAATGDPDRAVALFGQILQEAPRWLGEDHPHTIAARNNLASAYHRAGRADRAVPLFEQTASDCERVLGKDHPHTLATRNNLAGALAALGDLDRAAPLYERTLADRARVLGTEHPDTLQSALNLAYLLALAGDPAQAVPFLQQVVARCEQALGRDHGHTRAARDALARVVALRDGWPP